MLVMTAIAVVRMRRLFAVVMLFGIYSLLSALIFVVLDAVDVAFTEAAVGAGISTVFMLATLVTTGRHEKPSRHHPLLPLAVVVLTGAGLIWGTLDMPGFGNPDDPVHHHVADRYINDSPREIGIPNMVTSVLASYRGYDTMGEVIVVFTALMGVMSLTGIRRLRKKPISPPEDSTRLRPFPVLQVMAILLVPFIIVFALYVQFHGDYGPGGGFQAGVILASAIILYTLNFGLDDAMILVPPNTVLRLSALGVLLYGGTGVLSIFRGGNYLDYSVLSHDPVHGQHLGILLIELGVGITVAAVMIAIFFAFASRTERPE
ncbi:MAG: Na(+)/H(+) antiporter subunit B [bacterium]